MRFFLSILVAQIFKESALRTILSSSRDVRLSAYLSVPSSRNEKVEIFQRFFFLLLDFLSGLPWKTSAPTQPGQIRTILLARNLEV